FIRLSILPIALAFLLFNNLKIQRVSVGLILCSCRVSLSSSSITPSRSAEVSSQNAGASAPTLPVNRIPSHTPR
ncbi:hypothetical protein MKW98_020486, partial [Papaver atlanticum]